MQPKKNYEYINLMYDKLSVVFQKLFNIKVKSKFEIVYK